MKLKIIITSLLTLVLFSGFSQGPLSASELNDLKGKQIPTNLLDKVTVHIENQPLLYALNEISAASDLKFNYSHEKLPLKESVTLHMEDAYAVEALMDVLQKTNCRLYISKSGQLVIEPNNTRKFKAEPPGSIKGQVADATSGMTLPGTNVYLEGTGMGTITDDEGNYEIHQVPPGNYTLKFKFIGYVDASFNIEIESGETFNQDAKMHYAAIDVGEVVVTAQLKGQLKAINEQLSSNTIKNVVAEDRIKDIPDANAAETIGRLPGISIIRSGGEGQKVTIRGLAPQYNTVMVNGVRVPSTSRLDRSTNLTMISPSLLSGIEVTKALTADMDADAVGGVVNMKIKGADEGFHGRFAAQGGFNAQENIYNNYRLSGEISNRFFDQKLGIRFNANIEQVNRSTDALTADYGVNEEVSAEEGLSPLYTESITMRDQSNTRKRLGGGLIVDYKSAHGTLMFTSFLNSLNETQITESNSLDIQERSFSGYYRDVLIENTVITNALAGEYKLFGFMDLDFTLSYSNSQQDHPGDVTGTIKNHDSGNAVITDLDVYTKVTPAQLYNAVEIDESNLTMDGMSSKYRDIRVQEKTAAINLKIPFRISDLIAGSIKTGFKYRFVQRDNDETEYFCSLTKYYNTAVLNEALSQQWPDLDIDFEDPNKFRVDDFIYKANDTGFLPGEEGINSLFYRFNRDNVLTLHQILAGQGNSEIRELISLDESMIGDMWYFSHGFNSIAYDYNMDENTTSAYLMPEINIGKKITLYPGIRYEQFHSNYLAYKSMRTGPRPDEFSAEEITNERDNANWFPQLHLVVKPTDWLSIRLAKTRSLIRPEYRAFSPFLYYDNYSGNSITMGNINLQPGVSENYDVYASVYSNKIGLFTAGYFHKEISNIIRNFETVSFDPADVDSIVNYISRTEIITWENNEDVSTVSGFELDWQTNFWYLPSIFHGLVLNINYTHIVSQTSYPYSMSYKDPDDIFAQAVWIDTVRTGPMLQQPNNIINVTLGYDIGGFSARISFLYQGEVLGTGGSSGVGIRPEEDSYTDPYYRWDLVLNQKLPVKGMEVYFNLNNISNSADREHQSVLGYLSSVNYYGMTGDIGFRYTF